MSRVKGQGRGSDAQGQGHLSVSQGQGCSVSQRSRGQLSRTLGRSVTSVEDILARHRT